MAFVVLAANSPCLAQWSEIDRKSLAGQIEAAAKNLNSEGFPSPDGAKGRFVRDLDSVNLFLANNTSPENFHNWMQYLDVETISESLDEPDALSSSTARTIGREAVSLRYRLIGTIPGLELSVLTQLRRSTEELIDAIRFRDSERSSQQIAKQLDLFAEQVRQMNANPTAEDIASITQMIGLLDASGQATDLVDGMKSRFRGPNLKIMVSEQAVQSAVNRGINQSRPVRDCILGTRIVGTATLDGSVTADVLPSIGAARVQVSLAGIVNSRNVGYNGPVKLHTVSQGQVNATRTLHIDESGVRAEPTVTTASLNSQIVSIDHKLRLVRKIARRKAAQQKPQAERIAKEKLRQQVGSQFAEQTDEAASISAPDAMAKLRPMLSRLDLREPIRMVGSTDQDIYVDATLARRPTRCTKFAKSSQHASQCGWPLRRCTATA